MIHLISKWNEKRRARRRKRHGGLYSDANGYPLDMNSDSVETIQRVREFTMTTPERLNGLCEAVRYISSAGIPGDVVECGVWKGGSMMAVAEMLKQFGDTHRELYLFDTYEGMPAPTDEDVSLVGQSASERLQQELAVDPSTLWCESPLDEVRHHMAKTGYPTDRTHFVKGMVEDTIPENAPQEIALLRLDTDWYESTLHEMNHLFPRLVDGGVLIIDDYGHWQGARQAVDEYLAEHNIAIMLNRLDYTGRIGIRHAGVHQVRNLQGHPGQRAQAA
ncbi:TylF/MycF/NovP-related O-methyltransferase [Stieleria varia]|uniref:TylF/MycF/NovP-related O-methyltransferase n=1 Tax=Stieleria varia TaxID=2528005 RepID=UPI0018D1FE82|nr:TylF/MycF/NovP-related O-methyltransferase [Stieleria varia]